MDIFYVDSHRFLSTSKASYDGSIKFLEAHKEHSDRWCLLSLVAHQALEEAAPSTFEALEKIGHFPFVEARMDFELACNYALHGLYKTVYHHLRSFFELYLVGIYFLSNETKNRDAHDWLEGQSNTPRMQRIIDGLFRENNFNLASQEFNFKEQLNKLYWKLCDVVHTKGRIKGHMALSHSSQAQFIPDSLVEYIDVLHECIESVSIAFILRSPVLLIGLPLFQKFGLNPPASGFLEQDGVDLLRSVIAPERLKVLDAVAADDDFARDAKEWVMERPDVTTEEIEAQIKRFKDSI